MRIILVGAPDTDKRGLAAEIVKAVPALSVQLPTGYTTPKLTVGIMADYRMELAIAIERMWESRLRKDTVYTNSLLDSFVYSGYKLFTALEYDAYSLETLAKWEWTTNVIGSILKDSFQYDLIIKVPGYVDETGNQLEALLGEALEAFELPFIEASGDHTQDAEQVRSFAYGPRRTN